MDGGGGGGGGGSGTLPACLLPALDMSNLSVQHLEYDRDIEFTI